MTATTTPGTTDTAAVRRAIASTARPPRPGPLSTALTFGWRGMLKIKHVPEQLMDVTITPVLFVLMFTYLFGGALAGSTSAYLQYVLPGILVMSVVFTTVYSGVALNTDLTKGVVDRFRSLPIWRPAPLLGALLGDSVRYVVAGTVILVLGVVLGYRPEAGVAGSTKTLDMKVSGKSTVNPPLRTALGERSTRPSAEYTHESPKEKTTTSPSASSAPATPPPGR